MLMSKTSLICDWRPEGVLPFSKEKPKLQKHVN
uniref:Uncharacterized protein n=1 Tax=Arundo donax TaxID=35708 RepID=A0A0A9DUV4_ARUDO